MTRRPITLLALALLAAPLPAQVREVDPSSPDVAASAARGDTAPPPAPAPTYDAAPPPATTEAPPVTVTGPEGAARSNLSYDATFRDEEIFGAAEKVFGKGAQGLAKLMENVLAKQGRPTAYIGGREAGGAFAVGLRYGQGDLFHKVEGTRPVFWTGPSLGFDFGGAGSKVLILVYNMYDSQELFARFPLVEGNLYAIGGFTASYLRRGDVVLVPIRLGVGWRFGASVGYLRFSEKGRVLPF